MGIRRSFWRAAAPCAVVCMLAAGCAVATTTPEQSLAWERWDRCRDVSGVMLHEVRPDGQVTATYVGAAPGTLWLECMTRAAEQQTRERGLTAAIPAARAVERCN